MVISYCKVAGVSDIQPQPPLPQHSIQTLRHPFQYRAHGPITQNLPSFHILVTYNSHPSETYFQLPITKCFLRTSCDNTGRSLTCEEGQTSFQPLRLSQLLLHRKRITELRLPLSPNFLQSLLIYAQSLHCGGRKAFCSQLSSHFWSSSRGRL